jgi:anti-sigma28 factor (negative regulator of flagellin synthesis)
MNEPPKSTDADRVTTTATRQAEQKGRFERNALREAQARDSETRTDQVDQMRDFIQRTGYRVDSHAVA